MEVSTETIEIILAELQRGHQIRIGGSRSHSYYGYKDGSWYTGAFDEGHRDEYSATRQKIIKVIKGHFSSFQPLLKRPHERIIAQALHSGDSILALQHLESWEEMGDPSQEVPVLRAYLQWPEVVPSAEVKALIRSKFSVSTIYHVLMGPLHFNQTVENGLLGLKYLEVLVEIVGECPGWRRLRANFRQMSGDIAGAIADLEVYLETLPADHKAASLSLLEMQIARLKQMLEE